MKSTEEKARLQICGTFKDSSLETEGTRMTGTQMPVWYGCIHGFLLSLHSNFASHVASLCLQCTSTEEMMSFWQKLPWAYPVSVENTERFFLPTHKTSAHLIIRLVTSWSVQLYFASPNLASTSLAWLMNLHKGHSDIVFTSWNTVQQKVISH